MDEIDAIKERLKRKKKMDLVQQHAYNIKTPKMNSIVSKFMILIILFLGILIYTKNSEENKRKVYENLFNSNLSFTTINNLYTKYLGGILPFENLFTNPKPVFNEKLVYKDESIYKDGVCLNVGSKYLVPSLESGIVIFIGDKEEYGKTVIIQQTNGIDVWYGNVDNINVKIYDYVIKGTLLGESIDENLYLVYKKEGAVLDYKKYL